MLFTSIPFCSKKVSTKKVDTMNEMKLTILKWIVKILFIMALSVIYYLNIPITSSQVIFIPKGGINQIITYLKSKSVEVTVIDAYILRLIGQPQQGWIHIKDKELTRADFLYKLTTAKAAMIDITLIPGETTYIFLQTLSQELDLSFTALQKSYKEQAYSKEGVLAPNTYKIPKGISESKLVKYLLKESKKREIEISQKIFGMYKESKWLRFVTIASIIQKEAASIDEMPLISSVIYNRLKKGMRLQMDGTLNYGKYSHVKVTSRRIKSDRSSYNTYRIKGLPPYPVSTVSSEAIRSAIFPAKTNFLYFVKGKNGKHKFTRYYSTHIKNIRNATK